MGKILAGDALGGAAEGRRSTLLRILGGQNLMKTSFEVPDTFSRLLAATRWRLPGASALWEKSPGSGRPVNKVIVYQSKRPVSFNSNYHFNYVSVIRS